MRTLYNIFKDIYTSENPDTVLKTLECLLKATKGVQVINEGIFYNHCITFDFTHTENDTTTHGSVSFNFLAIGESGSQPIASKLGLLTVLYNLLDSKRLSASGAYMQGSNILGVVMTIGADNSSIVSLRVTGSAGSYTIAIDPLNITNLNDDVSIVIS